MIRTRGSARNETWSHMYLFIKCGLDPNVSLNICVILHMMDRSDWKPFFQSFGTARQHLPVKRYFSDKVIHSVSKQQTVKRVSHCNWIGVCFLKLGYFTELE